MRTKLLLVPMAFLCLLNFHDLRAQINLALNRPVTVSSTEIPNFSGSKAVDGNTSTRWGSVQEVDPQWITIDLGSLCTIQRVVLTWETAHAKAYQIQVSNDGQAWTSIYNTTTGDGGTDNLTGLTGSGRYIRMYGTARGNRYWGYSLWEFAVYGTSGIDTQAPSVPSTVTASNVTTTSFTLSWMASSDNVGVTGYEVFQNGISLGTSATTSRSITNLTSGTTYAMTVRARDAAGNWSAQSAPLNVTTATIDTQAPSVPTNIASSNITITSFTLSWTASTDNVGVTGYEVFQNGISLGASATTSRSITNLTSGTTYAMTVRARDAAGNWSAQSAPLNVTTTDAQAPSVPTNIVSSNITITSFTLSWTASTDNVGVTGYEVFQNGISLGTSATTSRSVTNLTSGTTYAMTVRARDAAGNWSAQSAPLNVTTAAGDTQAPSVPANLAASAITSTSFTLTWSASSDNVGVTGYEIFRNGVSAGIVAGTSNVISGLAQSTSYAMTVRARDAAGNWSSQSAPLNVTTATIDTQAPSVPTNIASSNITMTSFTLSWTASTDNVGVTGYEVFQNGASLGSSATTSRSITNVTPGTTYAMTVRARDAAGNWSAQSTAINVTTTTADTSGKGRLGINVAPVSDYATEFIWVDIIRYMRYERTPQSIPASQFDTNGYPLSLSSGQRVDLGFGAGTGGIWPAGDYHIFYEGEGTITGRTPNESNRRVIAPGHEVWTVSNNRNTWFGFSITATNAANHLRNLHIIMPGFENTWQTQPIHPTFIAHWQNMEALRFMDLAQVNNSPIVNWSQSPSRNHITQTGFGSSVVGVSPELLVELGNLMNKDIWVCMPHLASDDFVRQYATLVRNNLNPNLKVYVEYSNECWNYMFDQTNYCAAQGRIMFNTGGPLEYYTYRSSQVLSIWEEVWGSSKDRVLNVLAHQNVNPFWSEQMLQWMKQPQFNPSGTPVEVLSVAPYFYGSESCTTLDCMFNSIQNTGIPEQLNFMRQNKVLADKYNVQLIPYEGGQHLWSGNSAVQALYIQANRDPRMRDMYNQYFTGWKTISGNSLFFYYNSIMPAGQFGSWGALERQDQDPYTAYKYLALLDYIGAPVPAMASNMILTAEGNAESLQTAARSASSEPSLQLYPVPARENLNITIYTEEPMTASFILSTWDGKSVVSKQENLSKGNNNIILPLKNATSGPHFLRIVKGRETTYKRVILE
jgi:chitodextrinase